MKWNSKSDCPRKGPKLMATNIKTLIGSLGFFITLLASLSACGGQRIPYGEYRIEWDEYDPRLHGQVVIFNQPIKYHVFGPKDEEAGWKKEFVEIGRLLRYTNMDSSTFYEPESITDGMLFTIKGSFWIRKDWFNRDLHGDTHYLLMADENSIESVAYFTSLTRSNRPALANLEDEGRFRE